MILEVCCANIPSVRAAVQAGADRVELCRDLEHDGLTPTAYTIRQAVAICRPASVKVHVLIRPRQGSFVYTPVEYRQALADIRTAIRHGADGIVIGALTDQGDIDLDQTAGMIACARQCSPDNPPGITFHRAFDVCRDPFTALEQIIHLGCDRILTSGQQPTAQAGIPLLRQLVQTADGRITILCGSGVNTQNARHILLQTCATEIHGSLRTGTVTDPDKVRKVKEAIG